MEKNQLKWYETPVMEVVELEAKVSLLAGSPTNAGNADVEGGEDGEW